MTYYLPLVCKIHRRPDNHWPKKAFVPLFPGYMAVAGSGCRRILYGTGRVKGIIPVTDQEGFTQELQGVEKALLSNLKVELHPAFPLGSQIQIAHGPLKGITGRLERVEKHWHLVMCVELFQQCMRIKLPACDVKVYGQTLHPLQSETGSRGSRITTH